MNSDLKTCVYRITRNNRIIPKSPQFFSYERARQYVRKLLRKGTHFRTPDGSNPVLKMSSFGIRRI